VKKIYFLILVLFLFCGVSSVSAVQIDLFDWAFNENGVTYEDFLGDTPPGSVDDSLFDWDTGLGTLTVNYEPGIAGDYFWIAYFDHEIDELANTYFNEFGSTSDIPAAGQSWEIDKPGFVIGGILDNVLAGQLDNSNGVPAGSKDDVSMALGWDFTLGAGEWAEISFILGEEDPGGFYLSHTDPDSDYTFNFSSSLDILGDTPKPIPEPATLILLGAGVLGLAGFRHRRRKTT